MKLDSMTIGQILDLTDADIDALSEKEQRIVAEVIAAVLDYELHGGCASSPDPRQSLGAVIQTWKQQHKLH